jgi:hypothetical protein
MSEQTDKLRQFARDHGVAPQATQPGGKPQVLLPGGRTKISDTARALFQIVAPKNIWFYRGGAVVMIARENEQSLPTVQLLKPSRARSEFEKHADLFVQVKDGPTPAVMSEDTARAILESSAAKEVLPHLTTLINSPLLVLRDGQLHTLQPGYNAATGYYLTGAAAQEPATVEDAVAIIKSVIVDFTFQTNGDISRALAALLTPLLKLGGFINGSVPMDIVEANDSQTGKGYFVLLRAALYGEMPTYVAAKKGGVGSLDESFASALIKGRPFIVIDNYRGNLNSPYVESSLTAQGHFSVRVPHAGEMYVDPSRSFLAVTSNGMEATRDLANRAAFVRLEKQPGHRFQQFGGNDILTAVREHQPMFLGALFKVVRHWYQQGMPRTDENRHTFSDWAQTNDWIVQHIFGESPLMEGHVEAQLRFQDPNLSFARLVAIEVNSRNQIGIPLTATEIIDLCDHADIPIPHLRDNQRHNVDYGKRLVGKAMNKLFGQHNVLAIEGFVITRDHEIHRTEAGNTQDLKQYTFTRAAEQAVRGEAAA